MPRDVSHGDGGGFGVPTVGHTLQREGKGGREREEGKVRGGRNEGKVRGERERGGLDSSP